MSLRIPHFFSFSDSVINTGLVLSSLASSLQSSVISMSTKSLFTSVHSSSTDSLSYFSLLDLSYEFDSGRLKIMILFNLFSLSLVSIV